MQFEKILKKIVEFLDDESRNGKNLTSYECNSDPLKYFSTFSIKVDLDNCKEIILQEETKLELGGINKQSFSIIYPLTKTNLIQNKKITVLGPEIHGIATSNVDFGLFIILEVKDITEKLYDELLHFNFISNGIEGFLIRTIPRRFWCRISDELINNGFSFEFLGNAIMYLYNQKFKDAIEAMEIIIINSHPDSILKFVELTEEVRESQRTRWKEKIEKWKNNVYCDYDWDCSGCPYVETCDVVKDILEEREKIEE